MFTIDNVTYRNIQEQVQKNKSDIAAFTNIQFTLNNFGITVLGRLDSESDIPAQVYEYGDAYLIGEEEPYDIYIYTRTDVEGEGEFINMGPLSVAGPEGPQGPAGQDGADGAAATIAIGSVTTGAAGTNVSVTNSGTSTAAVLNFTIPRGAKGDTGATGAQGERGLTGERGPQGIQGIQGDPGQSFIIKSTISNTSQLPSPSTSPRNEAYVYSDGDASTPDRLYFITGNEGEEVWSYCNFASVGTTVSVNGSGVSTWNANTKQDALTTSSVSDGTITKVIGFDSLGAIVKGNASLGNNVVQYVEIPSSQTQILDAATIAAITATPQPCLKDTTTGAIYVPTATANSGTILNWYALRDYAMTEEVSFNTTTQRMSRTTWEIQKKFRASETPTESSEFMVEYVIGFAGDQLTSAVRKMPIASVARTGSYADLSNRPTIPSSASDVGALPDTMCTYQTTAPTAAIADGGVHIVYLSAEPATKYSGYIYLIDEA